MKKAIIPICTVAIVILLGSGTLFAQGAGPDEFEHSFKCNLKTVKNSWWCATDYAFLPAKEVEKKKEKVGRKTIIKMLHKGTDHKLTSKKACIQIFYRCANHMDKASRRPGKCTVCRKAYVKVIDMQPFFYVCYGCGGRGDTKKTLKHQTTQGHDQKIMKSCGTAGQWPHNIKKNPGD